ncbi:major facilitator superfamily domain-containing protein [Aspergillus karnatakaensis]|uniref:major facilitator superfamily domain-containing protein n=1 Tax=Aspergillus karnatakaensis TaxID=1810916 RepID=UPI003CCE29F2
MSEPKVDQSVPEDAPIISEAPDESTVNETDYPALSTWRLVLVTTGILLTYLIVGIDESIVSTALPTIASEFNSTQDIGAYGSAFLLPQAVMQPFFGKLYAVWNIKPIYLGSLILFEVGSVIAASAQTSSALIGGRALSGIGAVGLTVGGLIMLTTMAKPQVQNLLVGIATAIISISSVLGPLFGGVIVDGAGWRWCFWINLPIGGAVLFLLIASMTFPFPKRPERSQALREKLMHLDLLGTALLGLTLIPLLLALQYGVERPWDNPTVIAMFCLAGASFPAFLIQQSKRTREGLIPLRIIRVRNVWAACGLLSFLFAAIGAVFYYLPLWFQAVQGLSARDSGFRTIAYVVASAVGVGIAVGAMTKLPHLNPLLIAGSTIFWIATGLFTMLKVDSSTAYTVGIQVLAGGGFGLCVLCQTVCPRLVLSKTDVQQCHSVTLMLQVLASSFSIQIANIALSQLLKDNMSSLSLPPETVAGALGNLENIRNSVPAETVALVLDALNDAFQRAFNIGIGTAAVAWAFSLAVEWRRLEGKEKKIDSESESESGSSVAGEGTEMQVR